MLLSIYQHTCSPLQQLIRLLPAHHACPRCSPPSRLAFRLPCVLPALIRRLHSLIACEMRCDASAVRTHTNTYQAQSPRGGNAPSASALTEHTFTITVLANMVPCGLEPQTSRLLAERSSQLSYETRCCNHNPLSYKLPRIST